MRKFKKTLYCLLSAVVLTGCASSSNQLLKERENQPDNVFGTEEESTVAQINGVPADYISDGEPSFPSDTLSIPALHTLALSDTTFCSIFLSGSNAIIVGTGTNDQDAQTIVSYLDSLSVKECVILLPDLAASEAGGISALLSLMEDRIATVILPIVSTDEFTANVFDDVAALYPIHMPTECKTYQCFGYDLTFFYPYGTTPATSDSGFAIQIATDTVKTLLLSGTDTDMLNTFISNKKLSADIVINYSSAFSATVYSELGGRYAYSPFINDSVLEVRSQYQFASQFQKADYSLSCPDTDGTCVYLLGSTISVRTHVGSDSSYTLLQTQEETTLSDDATVFWDGVYYHKSAGCININTDALLREITLKTAEDNGYDICPNCWKN